MSETSFVSRPTDHEAPMDINDPRFYFSRELSLLEFQVRVLEEAEDAENPLLERLKFLSIVGSNLDEFYMVRVSGLMEQRAAGVVEMSIGGLSPSEELAMVRKSATAIMKRARECFHSLRQELDAAGIHLLDYADLSPKHRAAADVYFREIVFPVLTPMAFDPARPFPHISNLSVNFGVVIRDGRGNDHFARIKVPSTLPQLVPIKRSSGGLRKDGTVPFHHYFVWLDQLIAAHLDALFPGMTVVDAHPFRVTRDGDTEIKELEASDLLETIEEGVRRRRFGSVVRLTVHPDMPTHIREILKDNLEIAATELYELERPLALSDLMGIHATDRSDLKYPPIQPGVPLAANARPAKDIFAAIRRRDILLHHPYDSFSTVLDFLGQAAHDPDVLAIKMTLYRVGRNSKVVETLLEAQENRKQVAVLVELKARFDEESNIGWARALEREGVHVTYGLLGVKTHAKLALVVRKEGDGIRRYVHLGTGNYNPVTAQAYTDFGLFTWDDEIGADATEFFNYLTGYSAQSDYRRLLVAPVNLRSRLEALVEREIGHQREGRGGRVIFKMNALGDKAMIRLLYRAAQAGVQVDLVVRGICCLVPGVAGVSDNIRVVSVVGRFLEHSRIYYFQNGGDEEVYLGSADLLTRNIDRRVEVLFPLQDRSLVRYVRDEVLDIYLADNVKARVLDQDGAYSRVKRRANELPLESQAWLLRKHARPGPG